MCNELSITFVSTIAWGNRRDPQTWTGSTISGPMFDRGFTGHEHLFSFGLINMNGRMYDPVMSSFLSVDRYVQDPSNSQNFNRYSYCLNNPLKYVDPSVWYMNEPYRPYATPWGLGCHVGLEPRDFRDGSPFMTSWTLFGGGDGSVGGGLCSGGGGGGGKIYYGGGFKNYDAMSSSISAANVYYEGHFFAFNGSLGSVLEDGSAYSRKMLSYMGVSDYSFYSYHSRNGYMGYGYSLSFDNGNQISYNYSEYDGASYYMLNVGSKDWSCGGIGVNGFTGLYLSTTGLIMSSVVDGIGNPKNFRFYEELGQLHKSDYIKKGLVPKGSSRQLVGRKVAENLGRTNKFLSGAGLALSISEPLLQGELKASDIYYIGTSGACAALTICGVSGPVGWIVGGCLIAGEIVSYGVSGQSVGDNINEWCNNWSWKFGR